MVCWPATMGGFSHRIEGDPCKQIIKADVEGEPSLGHFCVRDDPHAGENSFSIKVLEKGIDLIYRILQKIPSLFSFNEIPPRESPIFQKEFDFQKLGTPPIPPLKHRPPTDLANLSPPLSRASRAVHPPVPPLFSPASHLSSVQLSYPPAG